MANKFDKIYRNIIKIDENKVREIITKAEELDTQEMLQYSLINKIPLALVTNSDGNNLIHLAINNSSKIKNEFNKLNFIKFLIQNNVNPDQPNKENQTPLHLACEKQYATIVEYLIDLHANINYQDNNGFTPLHYLLTGDIKPWEEKEIKEFIVPTPKIKETAEERQKALELKKEIWNNIKDDKFFNFLDKTIQTNLNDQEFINELIELNSELIKAKNNKILINNEYIKYKKKLIEYIQNRWGKFSNNPDIGLIEYNNLKKIIKRKIKNTINEINKLFDDYIENKVEINLNINQELIKILKQVLTPLKINSLMNNDINKNDIMNELDELYKKNIHELANDNADNIIDFKKLLFIGGSRQVEIMYDDYSDILNDFDSINEKILFIILIPLYELNNIEFINGFNIESIDDSFSNINTVITNISDKLGLDDYTKNYLYDIINVFILYIKQKNINKFYYNYINISCKYLSETNLNTKINILFFRFITAAHTNINFEVSLKDSLKIDNLRTRSVYYTNYLISLSSLIGYFLDQTDNRLFVLNNSNINIEKYIKLINDSDLIVEIKNLMIMILEDNGNLTDEIIEKIDNFYINMDNPIPKLYYLDLKHYIKYHNIFEKVRHNTLDIKLYDNRTINEAIVLDLILKNLPPSINGHIYNIIEILFTNNNEDENLNNFLVNKLNEAKELGLIYTGSLPQLININEHYILKISNTDFIFNPEIYTIDPVNGTINDTSTPLPFNYVINRNLILSENIRMHNYYLYTNYSYRPPIKIQYFNLINNYYVYLNNILLYILKEHYKILIDLIIQKPIKIEDIYNDLYYAVNYIINMQTFLKIKNSNINHNLLNIDKLSTELNTINFYFYIYYYFFKENKQIPEFIFNKLNKNNYTLYLSNSSNDFIDLVGGNININIITDGYLINPVLPPSLEDNLNDFYQYNKIFIINSYLSKNESKELSDLNIAKTIEEIIKEYAEHIVNIAVYNKLVKIDDKTLIIKDYQVTTILYNPYGKENDAKLPNFSDPDINKHCDFIIYPSEYTNTNLLKQKYCIYINTKIIDMLLTNKNIQPLLLDNNNNSCINPILLNFNSSILEKISSFNIYFNENKFIYDELINHRNKMFTENFIKTFENFTRPQFEEIKVLILSDESNGNNLLFTLKNSFYMCFYIINEYLTDYLWKFNENYKVADFKNIISLLKYDQANINKSYLNIFANKYHNYLYNDDDSLINKEIIKNYHNEISKLNKKVNNLVIEESSMEELKFKSKIEDIKNIKNDITNIRDDIEKIKININEKNKKLKIYVKRNNNKSNIIETYTELLGNNNGIYLSIWNLLFNLDLKEIDFIETQNEDDEITLDKLFMTGSGIIFNLENSINLSLLQILKENPNSVVEKYFDHISEVCHTYFNCPKYSDKNPTLNFIYKLLIHLTKTNICYGIEIVLKNVIFNYLKHKFVSFDTEQLNTITINIIDTIKPSLYDEYSEKIVKNSVYIFRDLDEKVNFESQTINELLRDLFSLLDKTYLNDDIINVLNNNIASYFDLFVSRTINNWYVVCENTFKFIINHDRIIKINNLMGVEISNNYLNIKKNKSDNDINEIINKTNKLFNIVENTNEKLKNILTNK